LSFTVYDPLFLYRFAGTQASRGGADLFGAELPAVIHQPSFSFRGLFSFVAGRFTGTPWFLLLWFLLLCWGAVLGFLCCGISSAVSLLWGYSLCAVLRVRGNSFVFFEELIFIVMIATAKASDFLSYSAQDEKTSFEQQVLNRRSKNV
jgi:hypothetical protein